MGIGKIILGSILIFVGVASLLRKIPDTQISIFADEINPILRFGVVDPTTGSLFIDALIISVVVIIGTFLLIKGFSKKKTKVI